MTPPVVSARELFEGFLEMAAIFLAWLEDRGEEDPDAMRLALDVSNAVKQTGTSLAPLTHAVRRYLVYADARFGGASPSEALAAVQRHEQENPLDVATLGPGAEC